MCICTCYSVLRMSGTAGRIALKFWCAVRDKLTMRFKLLRGGIHLHVRTSASRFRISGTAERIAPKFGMLLLRSQLARQLTQINGGVHLHVRACVPLFRTSGAAGRIVLKLAMGVERFTSDACYAGHGWGTNNCTCPISGFTGEFC